MLNGPAGTKGDKGDTGATGANGKTILSGIYSPSNLNTGIDGDFYIKTSTWEIFGPKSSGVWPDGVSMIIVNSPSLKRAYNYTNTDHRFTYDPIAMTLLFTLSSDDQSVFTFNPETNNLQALLKEKISATQYKSKYSFEPMIIDDGTKYISVLFEGVDNNLINNTQIVLS
jgi:hypothetical protein